MRPLNGEQRRSRGYERPSLMLRRLVGVEGGARARAQTIAVSSLTRRPPRNYLRRTQCRAARRVSAAVAFVVQRGKNWRRRRRARDNTRRPKAEMARRCSRARAPPRRRATARRLVKKSPTSNDFVRACRWPDRCRSLAATMEANFLALAPPRPRARARVARSSQTNARR